MLSLVPMRMIGTKKSLFVFSVRLILPRRNSMIGGWCTLTVDHRSSNGRLSLSAKLRV